jgi:prepilin peptidase CpaA
MSPFISQACLFGLCVLLLAVAISDVRFRRIPNLYVLGIIILYPAFVATSPVAIDWTSGLICFGALLIAGFIFSTLGLFGPGDAKFMAATSLWAGAPLIFPFLMLTALSGGVFAAFLWFLRRARERSSSIAMSETHLGAEATVSVSNIAMAGPHAGSASVLVGTSTPEIGSTGGEDESTSVKKRPAMELPYGAAIAFGGLAVAVMLLMRG